MNNNKYETHIKPAWNLIRQMCELGQTNQKIAENLGISERSFYNYVEQYPEFAEHLAESRRKPVEMVKSALLKRALGYKYDEVTTVETSKGVVVTTKSKHLPPDPTSCLMLLKHWAKAEGWTSDPQTLDLKMQELQFKKEQAAKEDW